MSEANAQQIQTVTKPTHFTVSAELDGFPVVIELEGKADNLRQLIDKLKAIGATAPQKAAALPIGNKPAGVPVCSIHNAPMKGSRKPGSYYCPRQIEGGEYCPEKG